MKGRLFQVIIVLGKNERLKISLLLAKRDDDLEDGIFFLEGTHQE
jgi:hypothetical protein